MTLDRSSYEALPAKTLEKYRHPRKYTAEETIGQVLKLNTNEGIGRNSGKFVYLVDKAVDVLGCKVYGNPACEMMAFQIDRLKAKSVWSRIPTDTDVLVTHVPPRCVLDRTDKGYHVGSKELIEQIRSRVRPQFHVFGHIHEAAGAVSDGTTTYINASSISGRSRRPLGTRDAAVFDCKVCTSDR